GGRVVTFFVVDEGATETTVRPAPDDHLNAGPDGRVQGTRARRVRRRQWRPNLGRKIVADPILIEAEVAGPAPDDQVVPGPDRALMIARRWRVGLHHDLPAAARRCDRDGRSSKAAGCREARL